MDDKLSLKGAWLHHMTCSKFLGPILISGVAEARALKFLYTKETISSLVWAQVTYFCMCNCGLRKISHTVN